MKQISRVKLIASAVVIALNANIAFANAALQNTKEKDVERIEVVGQQVSYFEDSASTALRQNVSILETPQSIFVINDELIKDQQSFRIDQVLQNDSSIQKADNFLGAYSSFIIRGFSLSNSTNYLRNGRPFFNLATPPIETLSSVEVLRGPASVLYGTMAPGGLINMQTKRATFRDTQGFVKLTTGSDSLQHIHLDIGGAINEDKTIRYRVNAVREDSENYRKFFDGSEFDTKRQIGAIALEWDLSESTLISVNVDDLNDDRPQDVGLIGTAGGVLTQPLDIIVLNQPWSHYNSDVRNHNIDLIHYFNNKWSIKTGYSFQDYERDRYDNQIRDINPDNGDVTMRARRRINRWDFENYYIDVNGEIEFFDIKNSLLFGVERTNVDIDNNETARNFDYITNIFNPVFYPDPEITTRPEKALGEEARTALFFQNMMHLAESWRLLVGVRFDDYAYEFGQQGQALSSEYDTDNLTPRIGLLYLPSANSSIYASYSESFEPNSPVGEQYENAGEKLDPTLGKMFEVGYKWQSIDGNMIFSSAVFQIDRANSPMETLGGLRIEQTGLQRHRGAELGLVGLLGDLTLTSSLTFLDAEIVRDDNASLIGNTPVSVPKVSASFWAEYQMNQVDGLSLQAGVFYESERQVDNQNTFELDAYTRFDAGAKYVFKLSNQHDLTLRLTASNLFNEEYFKGSDAFSLNWEGERQFRLSAEYAF